MEKVFKSKIGFEILIPICLVLGTVGVIMLINQIWFGVGMILITALFISTFYFGTYYKITPDYKLNITCGILFNETIDITQITKIVPTHNPLSSPALSLDRLEIRYNQSGSVLISPRNKQEFIHTLLQINPSILLQN